MNTVKLRIKLVCGYCCNHCAADCKGDAPECEKAHLDGDCEKEKEVREGERNV